MNNSKIGFYALFLVVLTSSVSAQLTQEQANTLETVSLVLMGISGISLAGLAYIKHSNGGSGSVSRPEATNKLKSVQSYVTTQIEMGNTLPNEDQVIEELEEAADLVEQGNYRRAMNDLEDIEDKIGKEFN